MTVPPDVADRARHHAAQIADPSVCVLPRALALLLVSSEGCVLDHHGGCQAHGYLSLKPGEICPQTQLRDFLWLPALPAEYDAPGPVTGSQLRPRPTRG